MRGAQPVRVETVLLLPRVTALASAGGRAGHCARGPRTHRSRGPGGRWAEQNRAESRPEDERGRRAEDAS